MLPTNGFGSKNDFFFFNRWLLKFAGLWLPESQNRYVQLTYKMYSIFTFVLVYCFFVPTEFISLFYTRKDLNDFTKNLSSGLTDLLASGKLLFWYANRNKIQKIMKSLEEDQFKYEPCEDFNPEEIFYAYKMVGVKTTGAFLGFCYLTLILSYIPPLFITIKLLIVGGEFEEQILPYYSWIPFRYDTPDMYLVALIYQAVIMFLTIHNCIGPDTLIMNLMNFMAYHFTLLQQAFLKVTQRKLKRKIYLQDLTQTEHEIMEKEMTEMVKQLQKILGICHDLENMLRYLILSQAMGTLFILCTCIYLVASKPIGGDEFFAETFYLLAMMIEVFLFCWFGNEVTLKANELSMYIWRSNWIPMSKKYKDSMRFTLMILKKPVYFTLGNFGPLTLSTFVNIVKTSYSFFAFLEQKK